MDAIAVLSDAFDRVHDSVHAVVADLTPEQLSVRVDRDANTIGWLVWHLTRVQDDHVAGVDDGTQAWTNEGWADRFALPFDHGAIGYGQNSREVAAVQPRTDLLLGYHDAVNARTHRYLQSITASALDDVVDERWDPPVTLGVRLVSVVNDDLQHVGQAAYVRGIVLRR